MAVGTGQRLTVRVGVGLGAFQRGAAIAEGFWEEVALLEELGYDSLWLADAATRGGLAPLPALAAVAARTERLKLGTAVLVLPPRNPVLVARELVTIDVLSGGRMLPAGGLGIDLPAEREALGVPREELVGRLEESVEIVKALWTGEPVTFHGRYWSLTDVRLRPRPARSKLEFWLGGRAPGALRRIGRIADGWLGSFVGPDEMGPMIDTIRATAAEAGRSIDEDHYGATVFAAPREEDVSPVAATLARRPELARADHVAVGTAELRTLLDRFLAAGASKFVVFPLASDRLAWLRELYAEVVAPIEAEGVVTPRG
jgi:probable F420-dependent oxidoreductase